MLELPVLFSTAPTGSNRQARRNVSRAGHSDRPSASSPITSGSAPNGTAIQNSQAAR